ncbi:MAG: hypothetical protein O7A03_04960, partial [Alphaproteobacteria bacterium]|nr:hypothetical protein [Alphaproteobacteria bacterium]
MSAQTSTASEVTPETPVLGVEQSLSGRRWVDRSGDARQGLALAQRLGVPELVGRVMAARGI